MKKIPFILIVIFIITSSFTTSTNQTAKTKLLVYYFHLTARCHTCATIEATTVEVLNSTFKKELNNGIIVFKSFNVDDKANEQLCKKYMAYGSTLALTKITKGKEFKIEDLTNMAFSKIDKPEIFKSELISIINLMLK